MPEETTGRVTVHLAGVKPGDRVVVDPADPYIAACLRHGYIVADEEPELTGEQGDLGDD